MQLHKLACSSMSLHAVQWACMQFLSSSEQLTRISQCLFYRYESSGYDYSAPSPGATFTSFRQVYTNPGLRGNMSTNNVSYHSETEITPSANGSGNDSSIEAGPSFNESLQRFKTASGHNQQLASWKSQMQSSSSRQSSVQRRVEETRTMITQSSQKSYHIE